MAIKKQEFYEGAALHRLARAGRVASLHYRPPFFTINDHMLVLLKYSAKIRSPWGFTFTPEEQGLLVKRASERQIVIGLVCGSDGIVAIPYNDYLTIVQPSNSSIHISCYRNHNQHYEVNGPSGSLGRKIPPSSWQRILDE